VSGEFVAAAEDAPEVYAEADDPRRPRVNFDECSAAPHADARPPAPAAPGRPARIDCGYARTGTANLVVVVVVVDPTAGRRHVTVTARRTKRDFAEQMRRVCDGWHPEADRVRVVPADLNTHTAGALQGAFAPDEARRLAARLESHDTPRRAPWPNTAGPELGVLAVPGSSRPGRGDAGTPGEGPAGRPEPRDGEDQLVPQGRRRPREAGEGLPPANSRRGPSVGHLPRPWP